MNSNLNGMSESDAGNDGDLRQQKWNSRYIKKVLKFSKSHILYRLERIQNYINQGALKQKFTHQKPSFASQHEQIYRDRLLSDADYIQFEKQAMKLLKQQGYCSEDYLLWYQDALELWEKLLEMERRNGSVKYKDLDLYGPAIWQKLSIQENSFFQVSFFHIIPTIYIEIDLQLYRIFTIMREDLALDIEGQEKYSLHECLLEGNQILHLLVSTFYSQGTKNNTDYLELLRVQALSSNCQIPWIRDQINELERSSLSKQLRTKISQQQKKERKKVEKQNSKQGNQGKYEQKTQEMVSKKYVKEALCINKRGQQDKINGNKVQILSKTIDQVYQKNSIKNDENINIDQFINSTIIHKSSLCQNIQRKLTTLTLSPSPQKPDIQVITNILDMMLQYFILAQTFQLYQNVPLFTLNNSIDQIKFLQMYLKVSSQKFLPHLQKFSFTKSHYEEFKDLWLGGKRFDQPQQECSICLQNFNKQKFFAVFGCSHTFCVGCLRLFVQQRLKAFEIPRCPTGQCLNSFLDQKSKFFKYSSKQVKNKLQRVQRFDKVSKDPKLKLCPEQSCEGIIKMEKVINPQEQKTKITCPECKKDVCSSCMMKFHLDDCDLNQLKFLQEDLKFRQCSRCKNVIQRSKGCPHMTCLCKYEFCYFCGGQWSNEHRRLCEMMPVEERGLILNAQQEVQAEEMAMFMEMMRMNRHQERRMIGEQFMMNDVQREIGEMLNELFLVRPERRLPPVQQLRPLRQLPLPRIQPINHPVLPPLIVEPNMNESLQNIVNPLERARPAVNNNDGQPQRLRESYCLPLYIYSNLRVDYRLLYQYQRRNDCLVTKVLIWILVGILSVLILPAFFIMALLLEDLFLVVGFFFYQIRSGTNRLLIALMTVLFPITSIIAFTIAIHDLRNYRLYRQAFNQVFPTCRTSN